MGIRGLLTAIVERKEVCSETVDLVEVAKDRGGIELLVDFYSFEHLLVRNLWQSLAAFRKNEYLRILGAEYDSIHSFVDKLVRDLKSLGIHLVFYIDGSKGASTLETRQKIDTWKFRMRSECLSKRDILRVCAGQAHISELSYDTTVRSVCLEMQVVQTLRSAGCEVVQIPMGEADVMLAKNLKDREKAFAVLSNDSDFCVFKDCCFIPNILFDLGGDLGLGQPLVASRKPQRLMCGVVSAARVRNMLQFPEEEMVIELSIIAGNDFTAPYLKKGGVTMASKLGIENHRNLFNFADWVRQYGRVQNCPQFKEEMDRSVDLRNAVEYSRQFYMLKSIPEENQEQSGYIHNMIVQRIRTGAYPPHILPMYRGFYWHRSILDDVSMSLPCEQLLAPLRAMIYGILLPRHRTGVMEWGQAVDRDVARNMNNAVDDRNLPTLNQIKDGQIFKNLRVFHYIMSHMEYQIPDKTFFDKYGRKTGFICYVLRYFLLLNWGQGLQLVQEEFLALAAVALGTGNSSSWQDMRICPDPRCVAIAGLFQDVYRHAYLFLGSLLHLTHEFPLPKDIFSGSKWTVYYAMCAGPHSFGVFPVSSSDQLCYLPADSVVRAQIERDTVLHDRRHLLGHLVEDVFPFDERRF